MKAALRIRRNITTAYCSSALGHPSVSYFRRYAFRKTKSTPHLNFKQFLLSAGSHWPSKSRCRFTKAARAFVELAFLFVSTFTSVLYVTH